MASCTSRRLVASALLESGQLTAMIVCPITVLLPCAPSPSGAAGGDLTGSYPDPPIADGAITDAKIAAANKDGGASTPSLRTLGSGAQQALPGNGKAADSNLLDGLNSSDSFQGAARSHTSRNSSCAGKLDLDQHGARDDRVLLPSDDDEPGHDHAPLQQQRTCPAVVRLLNADAGCYSYDVRRVRMSTLPTAPPRAAPLR